MIQTYSAERFRQKLAGLESPETRFSDAELEVLKAGGVKFILALREVFGSSLDRKTIWERISNGMTIAAAKSGGKGDKFFVEMIEYVKADANAVVGNAQMIQAAADIMRMSPETQRQFIRACVEYRMLLCLQARAFAQAEKGAQAAEKPEPVKSEFVEVPVNE